MPTQTWYYAQWVSVLTDAQKFVDVEKMHCTYCKANAFGVLMILHWLGVNPAYLCNLDFVFQQID
jgi:hypothetical protein